MKKVFNTYIDAIFWIISPMFLMGAVPEHIISYYLTRNLNATVRTFIVWGILTLFVVISSVKYIGLIHKYGRNTLKTAIIPVIAIILLVISVLRTGLDKSVAKNMITQTIYLIPAYVMAVSCIFEGKLKDFVGNFKWTALVLMPGMYIYIHDVITAPKLGGDFVGLNSIAYLSMASMVAIIIIGCMLDLFFWEKENLKRGLVDNICIFIYSAGIIFTGGRAPFLTLVLGTLAYVVAWYYWNKGKILANLYKMIPIVLIAAGCIIGHAIILQYDAKVMSPLYRMQIGITDALKYASNDGKMTAPVSVTSGEIAQTASGGAPGAQLSSEATTQPVQMPSEPITQSVQMPSEPITQSVQMPSEPVTQLVQMQSEVVTQSVQTPSEAVSVAESITESASAEAVENKNLSVSDITRKKIMQLCEDENIGFFEATTMLYKSNDEESAIWNECYQILQNSYGRIYLNNIAIDELKNHVLFGLGVYGYQKKYKTYPHNIFIECLADGGIIIGGFVIVLLIIVAIYILKWSLKDMQYVVPMVLMASSISLLIFSSNLYICREILVFLTYAYAIKINNK